MNTRSGSDRDAVEKAYQEAISRKPQRPHAKQPITSTPARPIDPPRNPTILISPRLLLILRLQKFENC